MHVLFANTGVQTVCVPLRGGSRYTTAQIGYGWQRLRCGTGEEDADPSTFPYIQWQIIRIHYASHKAQIIWHHMFGLIHDEYTFHIQLDAVLVIAII